MISRLQLLRSATSQTALIGFSLLACAALAWFVTAGLAGSKEMLMSLEMMSMHPMSSAHAVAFLGMWVAMMAAMMLPVVTPTVMAHHMVRSRHSNGTVHSIVFASGYLSVWFVIGLLPLAVFVALPSLVTSVGVVPLVFAGGALLVAGGIYQLTAWKEACLRHCRHPLDFLMTHDFSGNLPSTYRAGLIHGVFCLGCCWALMLVVIAVGMTNLIWMAAITVVFVAERWSRLGRRLHHGVAPVLIGAGAWLIVGVI